MTYKFDVRTFPQIVMNELVKKLNNEAAKEGLKAELKGTDIVISGGDEAKVKKFFEKHKSK